MRKRRDAADCSAESEHVTPRGEQASPLTRTKTRGPLRGRVFIASLASLAGAVCLALAGPASASPPTPPFTQCPGYGFDSSCAVLLVVNAHGGLESWVDPSQESYDAETDQLVGVLNDSSSTVTSLTLTGNNIFGFDGKGLCSDSKNGEPGFRPAPAGCPFGETGYEGPDTSFSGYLEEDLDEDANDGTVNFENGTIEAGKSAYFTLVGAPEVSCHETACEPTSLHTTLSGDSESGTEITVPEGTPVSDNVTLSGANASAASGDIDYSVFRDARCEELVAEEEVAVTNGSVPALGPATFGPGTYYWTMSYPGDSHNGASQAACGSEVENVTASTSMTTSLSGGAQTGTSVNVVNVTPVTDQATLGGANASSASGTLIYKVYSDNVCQDVVAESDVLVSGGSVPASSPVEVGLGTYYWRAFYLGDAHNSASETACGSEVETVSAPCSALHGRGSSGGAEPTSIKESVNTGLGGTQALKVSYPGARLKLTHLASASCVFRDGGAEKTFSGRGSAKQHKTLGYEVSFSITLAGGHTYVTIVVERAHRVIKEVVHQQLTTSKERIT